MLDIRTEWWMLIGGVILCASSVMKRRHCQYDTSVRTCMIRFHNMIKTRNKAKWIVAKHWAHSLKQCIFNVDSSFYAMEKNNLKKAHLRVCFTFVREVLWAVTRPAKRLYSELHGEQLRWLHGVLLLLRVHHARLRHDQLYAERHLGPTPVLCRYVQHC